VEQIGWAEAISPRHLEQAVEVEVEGMMVSDRMAAAVLLMGQLEVSFDDWL